MDKREVLASLLSSCSAQLKLMNASAKAAHDAATHPDAIPENQYDTRGLESSYLAGAQARRALEIERLITYFQGLKLKTFGPDDPIEETALVELQGEKGASYMFLVSMGGGIEVTAAGDKVVRTITPETPVGKALMGQMVGEEISIRIAGKEKDYEISSVF